MKKIEVVVHCCLCPEKHLSIINLPDGWDTRYPGVDLEKGFCPDHSIIAEWAEAQCPGCVGGWQDCSLWTAFAYGKRGLSDTDLKIIESGVCPKRTNGSFMFSKQTGFKDVALQETASNKSGVAFAAAIREYWKRYDSE